MVNTDPTRKDFGTTLVEMIDMVDASFQQNRETLDDPALEEFTRDELLAVVRSFVGVLEISRTQLDVVRQYVLSARRTYAEGN